MCIKYRIAPVRSSARVGLLTFISAITLTLSMSASAALVTFSDLTSFTSAAGGSPTTETFNSFTTEESFYSAPLDIGDFSFEITGTPLAPSNFIDIPPALISVFDVDGTTMAYVAVTESFLITFDENMTAFGADFASFQNEMLRSEIVINGESVIPSIAGTDEARFIGIVSDQPFNVVEIKPLAGSDGDGFGLDNVVYVSAVPVPAAAWLFGSGLLGLIGVARRKK